MCGLIRALGQGYIPQSSSVVRVLIVAAQTTILRADSVS